LGCPQELTDAFTLMTFSFLNPIETVEGSTQAPVLRGGVCHGVVVWIDWVFDPLGDIVLSTRPAGSSSTFNFYGIKQILYYSSV
jgi:protein arginine N-methyltransferase 7